MVDSNSDSDSEITLISSNQRNQSIDFKPLESLIKKGFNYLEVRREECLEDTLTYILDNQLDWRMAPNVKFTLEVIQNRYHQDDLIFKLLLGWY